MFDSPDLNDTHSLTPIDHHFLTRDSSMSHSSPSTSTTHWQLDVHLDALIEQGFCVIEQACSSELFIALNAESNHLSDEFLSAKIAQGGEVNAIRRDRTRWLEPDDHAGRHYLALLDQFAGYLNQQLYLGIQRVEAHYASYQVGDFYKPHRDNPTGNQDRAISTVLYLNQSWQPQYQGQLRLQDAHDIWHDILPLPNRLVIFQSDLLHEVCPALQHRQSIAGWLRRDLPLL